MSGPRKVAGDGDGVVASAEGLGGGVGPEGSRVDGDVAGTAVSVAGDGAPLHATATPATAMAATVDRRHRTARTR